MSQRELASLRGVGASALMKRANREGWEAERRRLSAEVSAAAQATISYQRQSELERQNQKDLEMSRAIRAQAAKLVRAAQDAGRPMAPNDLRSLATTLEVAQKVARLALGANTDNSVLTGANGAPLNPGPDVRGTPEEYRAILKEVLDAV